MQNYCHPGTSWVLHEVGVEWGAFPPTAWVMCGLVKRGCGKCGQAVRQGGVLAWNGWEVAGKAKEELWNWDSMQL